jgi:hypothetical protein
VHDCLCLLYHAPDRRCYAGEPYQHMGRLSRELVSVTRLLVCVLHDLHFGEETAYSVHALTCSLRSFFSASVNSFKDVSFCGTSTGLVGEENRAFSNASCTVWSIIIDGPFITPNQVVDTSIRRVFIGLQVCFVVMSFRHVKHSEVLEVRMHVGVQNCTRSVHIYERFI